MYRSYLSSHYVHLNVIDEKAFESAVESYGRMWEQILQGPHLA